MTVAAEGIVKRFGAFAALEGVSLEAREGEFLALLGPSGSGKTTLLRIMAGLDFPDAGRVLMGGVDMSDSPARERGVGFVFQHYALFRHMTVAANIAFGLTVKRRRDRPAAAAIAARDGTGVAFVRPHEFGIGAAAGDGIRVTVRRIADAGALAMLECAGADGRIVEASIETIPPTLAQGDMLTLLPRVVRAYPA